MTHPIIINACEKFGIGVNAFLGYGRNDRLMNCREYAMRAFRHDGYSWKAISEITGRRVSTLGYWLNHHSHERKKVYMRERWHRLYKSTAQARGGII